MFDTDQDTAVSIDDLEQELLTAQALIGRVQAHQLRLLRQLDSAQVATADGARNLAEWAAARLDMDPRRARELIRTARSLADHPDLEDELAEGVSSFDRVRATAELADSGAPDTAVDTSRGLDITGVRRLARRWHRITPQQEAASFGQRYLMLQPSLDESSWTGWFRLPGLDGRILDRALDERADEFPRDDSTRGQRRADALSSIAQDSLTGSTGEGPDPVTHLASVFIDADALAGTNGEAGGELDVGPRIGPQVLQELLCTGSVELIKRTRGKFLGVGRKSRVIPRALRRAVIHRDGGCAVDGCQSRYRLQAHHILPLPLGETEPENLVTLCWYHHHVVVHGRGLAIDPDSPPGRVRFIRRPGRGPPG